MTPPHAEYPSGMVASKSMATTRVGNVLWWE